MEFSIGGAFSGAWEHVKSRFGLKFGITALFTFLPLGLLTGAGIWFAFAASSGETLFDPEPTDPFSDLGVGLLIGLFVAYLLLIFMTVLGQSVLAALMDKDRENSLGEAMSMALRAMPTLVATVILAGVIYFLWAELIEMMVTSVGAALAGLLGFMSFLLLFWLAVRFAVTLPVIVLGGVRNPLTALAEAWRLSGLSQWALLGYFVILLIGLLVFYFIFVLAVGGVFGVAFASTFAAVGEGGMGSGVIISIVFFFLAFMAFIVLLTFAQVAFVVSAYQQFVGTTSVADTFD